MASNYPTSLDDTTSLPTRSSGNTIPSSDNNDKNSALIQVETKLGTGASTPTTTGHLLTVTGAGATAWQAPATVTDATISTSDITTNNVSTTKHGFAPKAPNVATQYLDGTGAWSTPAGGGSSVTRQNYMQVGSTRYGASRYMLPNQMTGLSLTNATLNNNQFYFVPWFVGRNATVNSLALNVTTAEAATSARLGIYNNTSTSDLYPSSLVIDAGTVSLASTAFASVSLSQAVTPGLYWLCLICNGAGASAVSAVNTSAAWPIFGYTSASPLSVGYSVNLSGSYAALPSTASTGGTIHNSAVPAIYYSLSA